VWPPTGVECGETFNGRFEPFARVLDAAANPKRAHPGIAERDRLVLLTLATTGLRRSADCARLKRRDARGRAPVVAGAARQGRQASPAAAASRARVRRASDGAGISKHVTAHTLRHTAATWLRQATGDTRLVAEYLGHADLSTVARYAHVATEELHAAAQSIADGPGGKRPSASPPPPRDLSGRRERVHPGQLSLE
jgi:integrase